MIFKSQIVTQASGSVGGSTFARNAGGMYIRARAMPKNKNSPAQATVRIGFGTLSKIWLAVLTNVQRAAWTTYAANVTVLNKLGDAKNLSPLAMFKKANQMRSQFAVATATAAPTVYTLANFTAPTLSAVHGSSLTLKITNTDDWATTSGGILGVYASTGQNATRNRPASSFIAIKAIKGSTATPPAATQTMSTGFAITAGQKLFVRCAASNANGQPSNPVDLSTTVL